ncbi:type IV secretory system conjugative DNA transfer family protein [Pseudoalteromonas rubra]|uniref:Recombinase n=1 Tax=Pseudoalteromonas rubra TaxID=43658 RepID=A0A0F4QK83_9GAMM|nr:type IV secretory system conjugative DNA transfer family protein [Pseudoalteromonas rubra]KJZ07067.1 recombinase [Pseudoalteromonas rubra]
MSKIIKGTFSSLLSIGSFIAKKKLLVQEQGARFASQSELSSIFSRSNKGVLINGNDKRLSLKDSFEHLAVIAKPGSGKTTAFIIPSILELGSSDCSMIVNDPSGEVYQLTSGHLASKGFRIVRLCPEDLPSSSQFNPFAGLDARHTIEIEQICASIILSKYGSDKEPVWNEGAISILEVLSKCLAYSQPENLNLVELNSLVLRFGSDGTGLDEWVAENSINPFEPNDRSLWESWLGLTTSNEKMLSSYVTICKTALKQLNNQNIRELMRSDTLDLQNIRNEKTIIYLNFSESKQAYYQFIIDLFYVRFLSIVMDHKPSPGELDVFGFLDEMGNCYINDFNISINNVRKYRVSLSLVFQGISQLDDKYGHDKARAIKAGIGSFLIFRGGDLDTNTEFSKVIGDRALAQREHFTDIRKTYERMPLLAPEQLRTLGSNQAVFISSYKQPTIVDCMGYFEHGRYSRLSKKKPAPTSKGSVTLDFDTTLRL